MRGFRHRAPTLFLPTEELTPIEPAYIDTSIKIDEKAHFYRNNFFQKEHMNLVGYSRVWGPLVLSVRQEQKGKIIIRLIIHLNRVFIISLSTNRPVALSVSLVGFESIGD